MSPHKHWIFFLVSPQMPAVLLLEMCTWDLGQIPHHLLWTWTDWSEKQQEEGWDGGWTTATGSLFYNFACFFSHLLLPMQVHFQFLVRPQLSSPGKWAATTTQAMWVS